MNNLSSVIYVDKNKCVNCHSCIVLCPVKYCNDASGDYVKVNESLCIGCGNCIKACSHSARSGIDNSEEFFSGKDGSKYIAIAAPAVASNFPDKYLKLNGFLKTLGVESFFDVSFGAELTIKSYLTHIKTNSPKAVISQPCPAIVTYIELYKPELLNYLAPADSPMTHTIKMIKEYYPEYKNHKIVVLSPCYAKRREFDELGYGLDVINLTYKSIDSYLKNNQIDLNVFPEIDYLNQSAERGVLFSTPGGLMLTAERDNPGTVKVTRKIEGNQNIYPYLEKLSSSIEKSINPLLIDCLNCEMGCNGGAGTLNQDKSADEIEFPIEQRNIKMQKMYKKKSLKTLTKAINKYWKKDLYNRTYLDLSSNNNLQIPNNTELKDIYKKMHKFQEKDLYNCNTCGYGFCSKMAYAIFNGLNKPENCHHYNLEIMKIEHEKIITEEEKLKSLVNDNKSVTYTIEDIVKKMISNNLLISEKTKTLVGITNFEKNRYAEINEELIDISKSIVSLDDIVHSIISISRKSNILALNATIEASRAGIRGKAFSVVAEEVKKMAVQSEYEAKKIEPFAEELKTMMTKFISKINESFGSFNNQVKLIEDVTNVAENIINVTNDLKEQSKLLVK